MRGGRLRSWLATSLFALAVLAGCGGTSRPVVVSSDAAPLDRPWLERPEGIGPNDLARVLALGERDPEVERLFEEAKKRLGRGRVDELTRRFRPCPPGATTQAGFTTVRGLDAYVPRSLEEIAFGRRSPDAERRIAALAAAPARETRVVEKPDYVVVERTLMPEICIVPGLTLGEAYEAVVHELVHALRTDPRAKLEDALAPAMDEAAYAKKAALGPGGEVEAYTASVRAWVRLRPGVRRSSPIAPLFDATGRLLAPRERLAEAILAPRPKGLGYTDGLLRGALAEARRDLAGRLGTRRELVESLLADRRGAAEVLAKNEAIHLHNMQAHAHNMGVAKGRGDPKLHARSLAGLAEEERQLARTRTLLAAARTSQRRLEDELRRILTDLDALASLGSLAPATSAAPVVPIAPIASVASVAPSDGRGGARGVLRRRVMFETLTRGFRQARNRLAGLTELTEGNIEPALREVRLSLLEADVEIGVVKAFLSRVKAKAVGRTLESRVKHQGTTHEVTASDLFIKICHDELASMMEHVEGEEIAWASSGPTGIMMVGLQGSGKTTTCAKLARWLAKEGKKPLLVAADMQRPAAVEQLQVLGQQIDIPVFNIAGASPVAICAAARDEAKKLGRDVIVYDTAGRLAIDEPLMQELAEIKAKAKPDNIFLVVDAMIGQDAVKTARGFHERLQISGVVLTKLDGDARGGAALSIKEVTGAPVLFSGVGETTDKFEPFRADGMASRILGLGDVVGLMKDFEEVVDQKKAEKDAERLLSGEFGLEDFLEQVRMIQKMGSLKELVDRLPLGGMFPGGLPENVNLDDKELVKIEAIIQSMTRFEKNDPYVLIREPGRVDRVAKGSGTNPQAVSELVQRFLFMRQMMSGLGQNLGLLGRIPGMKQMAMARNMKKAMAGGMPGMMPGMGFPGMGFPGMPGMGMPGMMPGMGAPADSGMTKMRVLSQAEKNAKKAQRKRERDARKKGRK